MSIVEILAEVPDPRRCNASHALADILFVALAAMLCGATSCTEMAFFAEGRLELLRQFVPLEGGAPSHDTFSRVFRGLDPEALAAAFGRVMVAFGETARRTAAQVAIDGKSLRRAYEKGRSHMPPLVVTVFECETFMSLRQAVSAAGGEAEAAIEALRLLDLSGRIVSGDALHCHKRLCQTVIDRGGDYVLTIKGNQSNLAKEANAALDTALDAALALPSTAIAQTYDDGHGREEVRTCAVVPFRQTLGKNALPGLVAVARIVSQRTVGAVTTIKVRAYALSCWMTAEEVLDAVRRHWEIENNLHWQLDVLLKEDQSRSRKDYAAKNLAVIRRLALNTLRADPRKIPLSHKQHKARWSDSELLTLMTHMR